MADEPDRRASDITLAQEIAERLRGRLDELARGAPRADFVPRHDVAEASALRPQAFALFRELVGEIWQRLDRPQMPLPPPQGQALVADLEFALRLSRFYAEADRDDMLMLRAAEETFQAHSLIDVFSLRARQSLGVGDTGPRADAPDAWPQFGTWIALLRDHPDIIAVERKSAQQQFLTLFTDATRALVRLFSSGGPSQVSFTVTCGHGYHLEVHPYRRFNPVAFGTKPSSPVTAPLDVGHYGFQGTKGGVTTRDTIKRYAGPGSTATTLSAF